MTPPYNPNVKLHDYPSFRCKIKSTAAASYRQPHNRSMPENRRVMDAMNHKFAPLKGASLLSLKPVGPNPELNTDEGGVGIIDEGVPVMLPVPVPVPVLVPVPVPVPVGVVPVPVPVGVVPVPVPVGVVLVPV
ncbi:hypothetical protein OIU79_006311, partial [Salix purpurea]